MQRDEAKESMPLQYRCDLSPSSVSANLGANSPAGQKAEDDSNNEIGIYNICSRPIASSRHQRVL
jgi:hypothetical protein